MSGARRIAIATAIALAVPGYGWWHAANHGTVYLHIGDRTGGGRPGKVLHVEFELLDAAGVVLARGKTDGKFGVAWMHHPTAGYCGPDLANPAYKACFDAHSTWLPTWVPRVRAANVATGQCRLAGLPLRFSEYPDSPWTWWIPLPHVGGTPYTNYSAELLVDFRACAAGRDRN